ncbi:hypothetical protein BU185_13585, partial [Enterococcus faecium]
FGCSYYLMQNSFFTTSFYKSFYSLIYKKQAKCEFSHIFFNKIKVYCLKEEESIVKIKLDVEGSKKYERFSIGGCHLFKKCSHSGERPR